MTMTVTAASSAGVEPDTLAAIARRERMCAAALAMALLLGLFAQGPSTFPRPEVQPPGGGAPPALESPMLALELASSPDELPDIVGPSDGARARQMVRAIHVDNFFVFAYATALAFLGWLIKGRGSRWIAVVTVVAGVAAAVCDLAENRRMLLELGGAAVTARAWAAPKWAFLFLALASASRAFVGPPALLPASTPPPLFRRGLGYAAAIGLWFAALTGLGGVFLGADALIDNGRRLLGFALFFGLLYLPTRTLLGSGLSPALDRLARLPVLCKLARWPSDEIRDDLWIFEYRPGLDPGDLLERLRGWAKPRGRARLNGWKLEATAGPPVRIVEAAGPGAGGREAHVEGVVFEIPERIAVAPAGGPSIYERATDLSDAVAGLRRKVIVRLGGVEVPAIVYIYPRRGPSDVDPPGGPAEPARLPT